MLSWVCVRVFLCCFFFAVLDKPHTGFCTPISPFIKKKNGAFFELISLARDSYSSNPFFFSLKENVNTKNKIK